MLKVVISSILITVKPLTLFPHEGLIIGHVGSMSVSGNRGDGSNPSISMLCHRARHFIRIASVNSAVKRVPGGDNLVKDVQCYELFGGIALKNHFL